MSVENKQAGAGRNDDRTRLARLILRRERGQRNINFPCSADNELDWQPYIYMLYVVVQNNVCMYSRLVVFRLHISERFYSGKQILHY